MSQAENTPTLPESDTLWKIVRTRLRQWSLATVDPLLLIVHLTTIYVVFLRADMFLLEQINLAFSPLEGTPKFIAALLDGIKIFSAVGTAVGYGLHLIYSLFRQGKTVANTIRGSEK